MSSNLSNSFSAKTIWIIWTTALFCLAVSFGFLISEALTQPYFVDELANTQSAVNFISHGTYSPKPDGVFAYGISTGIVSSWPSALSWVLGNGRLLNSRIILIVFGCFQATLLAFLFFRSRGYDSIAAIGVSAALWVLSLKLPYSYGFALNLGELSGALWVVTGLLLLEKRPFWATFCWGLAVWGCKFIYLPFVGVFGLAHLFNRWKHSKATARELLRVAGAMSVTFFLPLVLWVALIAVRFDLVTAKQWMMDFGSFVLHGNSGMDGSPQVRGLADRLASPLLEWSGYAAGTKVKIVLATLGAAVAGASTLVCRRRMRFKSGDLTYIAGAVFLLLFFSSWYFLWHPFMWVRHVQPAMYLGFGLLVYFVGSLKTHHRTIPWILFVGVVLSAQMAFSLSRSDKLRKTDGNGQPVYAVRCADLFGKSCIPG